MRKLLLAITIILALLICGCAGANAGNHEEADDVSVIVDDDGTVNGYRINSYTDNNTNSPASANYTYYANKNSKTFHKKDCTYATRIKNENLYLTSDRQELINSGYHACKFCKP